MKTYYENSGILPNRCLPKAIGKAIHLSRIRPLSVPICTIVATIVASSAVAAPISCYTPPDGAVASRVPRVCVKPSHSPNSNNPLKNAETMTARPAGTGMSPAPLNLKVVMRQGWQQMLPATVGFQPSNNWGYADGGKYQFAVNATATKTVSTPTLYGPDADQPMPGCCPSALPTESVVSASDLPNRGLANGPDRLVITLAPVFTVVVFAIAVTSIQSLGRRE